MTYLAFFFGLVLGAVGALAYNHFKPQSFDKLTDKAATKVKEKL